jgi:GT2 family glycosyltransferase
LCQALSLHHAFPRIPLFAGREMNHWDHGNEADVEVISGCFWVARKQAIDEIGGLDERFFFYAEDVDWCKRFRDAGWRVMLQPAATATHFGGGSSINAPLKYSVELHRANLAYWSKHHGAAGMAFYYLISLLHHATRLAIRSVSLITVRRGDPTTLFKLKRSWACLRWLLCGIRP